MRSYISYWIHESSFSIWWLWSSWSQQQYLCFISCFSGTVHLILSPCCVIQQLLKLNSEILVSCVHCNQPSFIPPLESTLPFIPSTKVQKGDSGRRKGLLPSPQRTQDRCHCGDKMCPPCPSPQSAVSLRQLQPSELMSAVGCGALVTPCIIWSMMPGRWFLSQVCSEGSLRPVKSYGLRTSG